MRCSRIYKAWGAAAAAVLLVVLGCTREVASPPVGGGLKVLLSKEAAAVDHGWLVLDRAENQPFRMARVGDFLESEPITVDPGLHLFEITAVDALESPLFFGQASATVAEGAANLALEIVLRLIGPECQADADTLDFGTVPAGTTVLDTLVVANAVSALGDLVLDVAADCEAFAIISGAGPGALQPGQQLEIVVAFTPEEKQDYACTLVTGAECGPVALLGKGEALPACTLVPATGDLDFGSVLIGTTSQRSFTLTNSGAGVLSGSVGPVDCPGFTLVSGAGAYDLEGGQSRTVEVAFTPEAAGAAACSVPIGSACGLFLFEGSGDLPPDCVLTPAGGILEFGSLPVGAFLEQEITVRNGGGGELTGVIGLDGCPEFSLIAGGGVFSLAAGESLTAGIRFAPQAPGEFTCALTTGSPCGSLEVSGSAEALPACSVTPAGGTLDFGLVAVGAAANRTFVLTNSGGGLLEGDIGPAGCAGFTIIAGGGSFSLAAGQARTVEVEFIPPEDGEYSCSIPTGTPCGAVALVGTGDPLPACALVPAGASLDFGTVEIGRTARLTFTVTNTGGGLLEGTVQADDCTGFSLIGGAGDFALAPGQSRTVTVAFSPAAAEPYTCTVGTGTACGDISLRGLGTLPPACTITPADLVLDLGQVPLEETAQGVFSIKNTGGGLLSGEITAECSAFTLVTGGGPFSLAAGKVWTVTVEFTPTTAGEHSCTIGTGTACADVVALGSGDLPPVCVITPAQETVDFGEVSLGQSSLRGLTITNDGGGILTGEIALAEGPAFAVGQGAGPYALAAGESVEVTVVFSPVKEGTFTGTLATGSACGPLTLTGEGVGVPVCAIETTVLDFGVVPVGQSADLGFAIFNTGTGTLLGIVAEDSEACELVQGGGAYALQAGQVREVVVRFAPEQTGSYEFRIETGTDCTAVSCFGVAEDWSQLIIQPDVLLFGEVFIGETGFREFTIRNGGGGFIEGYLYEVCEGFAIERGAGPFTLGGGESLTASISFTPTAPDTFVCFVQTAAKGNHIACVGLGVEPPGQPGPVEPTSLDFGRVPLGETATLTFVLTNTGHTPLSSRVQEGCRDFQVLSGGGEFSLVAGESRAVAVQFAPLQAGPASCRIQLHGGGEDQKYDQDDGCRGIPARGEGYVPDDRP